MSAARSRSRFLPLVCGSLAPPVGFLVGSVLGTQGGTGGMQGFGGVFLMLFVPSLILGLAVVWPLLEVGARFVRIGLAHVLLLGLALGGTVPVLLVRNLVGDLGFASDRRRDEGVWLLVLVGGSLGLAAALVYWFAGGRRVEAGGRGAP